VGRTAFSEAYEDRPPFRSCTARTVGYSPLHLVFRGDRSDDVRAIAIFWCGSCMYGLAAQHDARARRRRRSRVSEPSSQPDFRIGQARCQLKRSRTVGSQSWRNTRFALGDGRWVHVHNQAASSGRTSTLTTSRDQLSFDAVNLVRVCCSRSFLKRFWTCLLFGQTRGTAPSLWSSGLGYVGGVPDPATKLENLALVSTTRPMVGFLLVDPVLEAGDPNQLNGYDYAGNDPATGSDPTG